MLLGRCTATRVCGVGVGLHSSAPRMHCTHIPPMAMGNLVALGRCSVSCVPGTWWFLHSFIRAPRGILESALCQQFPGPLGQRYLKSFPQYLPQFCLPFPPEVHCPPLSQPAMVCIKGHGGCCTCEEKDNNLEDISAQRPETTQTLPVSNSLAPSSHPLTLILQRRYIRGPTD